MAGLNVLVVGASIAGPATAYWLAKAGAKVTVIERFPSLRAGGQAVDIRTAGVTVMRKMAGMEALVRAKSTQEEGVSFVRDSGRPYGTIRASGDPDQQGLISEFEINRGDLAQVLFDLTSSNENITYIFGEQITSMQQEEVPSNNSSTKNSSTKNSSSTGVKVEFANGLASSTYDLVVACDGATSRTRAIGFHCNVRDHIVPTNNWTVYFSAQQDLLDGSKISQGSSAVRGRFMSIGPDPSGPSRIMFMTVSSGSRKTGVDTAAAFRQASAQGDDALKAYIAEHYRDAGWKVDMLLREMMDSHDFYASEIVQVKMPTLNRGRFVLVGDAGYAAGPTGGGTSLALTGAYILAGELAKHAGNVAAGLEGYEEQMRPIIKDMQKIPPLVSSILAPQTKLGINVRNYFFALVASTKIAEFGQKYLGRAFANTAEFPLPEYKWVF